MRARQRQLRAKQPLLPRQRGAPLADAVEADLADRDDARVAPRQPLLERAHDAIAPSSSSVATNCGCSP